MIKDRIEKLEKRFGATADPDWRERLAKEAAKRWVENLEPLFSEIYNTTPKSFDEIFRERMRALESFQSEADYQADLENAKPCLLEIEKQVNYRARVAEDAA